MGIMALLPCVVSSHEHWGLLRERPRGGRADRGLGLAMQGVQAFRRGSLLTSPVFPADRQGAADSGGQGAAPEGQVPAGSAEPAHPAAGVPGKGDPEAQQGGRLASPSMACLMICLPLQQGEVLLFTSCCAPSAWHSAQHQAHARETPSEGSG